MDDGRQATEPLRPREPGDLTPAADAGTSGAAHGRQSRITMNAGAGMTKGEAAAGGDPLVAALTDYAARFPGEAGVVGLFRQLQANAIVQRPAPAADPYARARLQGHFTASSWLVDAPGRRVLLTHHRKLGRWLQLGGHADGERDLRAVALKEAEEESGLADLAVEGGIFDLDRHRIPEHKGVPAHWHYDVRYVVRAVGDDFVVSDESLALAWRPIAGIADDPGMDASLRRMARKWLARGGDRAAVQPT